jgi:hypothetical protein
MNNQLNRTFNEYALLWPDLKPFRLLWNVSEEFALTNRKMEYYIKIFILLKLKGPLNRKAKITRHIGSVKVFGQNSRLFREH